MTYNGRIYFRTKSVCFTLQLAPGAISDINRLARNHLALIYITSSVSGRLEEAFRVRQRSVKAQLAVQQTTLGVLRRTRHKMRAVATAVAIPESDRVEVVVAGVVTGYAAPVCVTLLVPAVDALALPTVRLVFCVAWRSVVRERVRWTLTRRAVAELGPITADGARAVDVVGAATQRALGHYLTLITAAFSGLLYSKFQ